MSTGRRATLLRRPAGVIGRPEQPAVIGWTPPPLVLRILRQPAAAPLRRRVGDDEQFTPQLPTQAGAVAAGPDDGVAVKQVVHRQARLGELMVVAPPHDDVA